MSSTTMLFGVILTVIGVGGYVITGPANSTFIPGFFGIILLVLGFLGRSEPVRMHAMHAAAAVALIGFVVALFSVARAPFSTRPALTNLSLVATTVLTAFYVLLSVRSFRAARR